MPKTELSPNEQFIILLGAEKTRIKTKVIGLDLTEVSWSSLCMSPIYLLIATGNCGRYAEGTGTQSQAPPYCWTRSIALNMTGFTPDGSFHS